MMIVYLASPSNQLHADYLADMPVLLSYALWAPLLDKGYQQSFSRLLIDSGAYSELNSGVKVNLDAYAEWAPRWVGHADAIAGLDDISGDWRRSLRNYERFPLGFPTMHDTDPPELLKDLIPLAQERGRWLGIGLKPPRECKEKFVRWVCDNVPESLHLHGWALRYYTHIRRLDSVDSTNWVRDAMKLRTLADLSHLTFAECLSIVIKRYQRWQRTIRDVQEEPSLFDALEDCV